MKNAYFKYILALLFFGSNGLIASFIDLNSYEIVFLRSLLGSILLILLFLLSGNRFSVSQHKGDLIFITLSGVAMAVNWLFLFEAYGRIGVSLGMLINYTGPVIVMALSPLLFNERITFNKILGLAAALTGVFLISGKASAANLDIWGFMCAVFSAFAYAFMVIFNKLSKKLKGLENATLQLFVTFLTVALFIGFKQGFAMDIARGDWLPIMVLGFVNTGLCCYLYFSSIGHLPAQTVAVCGYLEPLSAVVLAFVFLHEVLSPLQLLGAALIIGGALLGENIIKKK